MDKAIQLFDKKEIRTIWDDNKQDWLLSVVDVVGVLTDSPNPRDYFKKIRKRDKNLNFYVGTKCPLVKIPSTNGKLRKTLVGNKEGILRIIQSIPSPKAEPFKLWLAKVGSERIEETINPELSIRRGIESYRRKGYSDEWINQRLKSIEIRKELTDEWERSNVKKGYQFGILTDVISKEWSGLTTKEYKEFKGLKKENLRDNMTNLELVLNMLAEATTTKLSVVHNPQTFKESKDIASRGGKIAGNTRKEIEENIEESVITKRKILT